MTHTQPYRIKTISEFHQLRNLPRPEHPLISVVDLESIPSFPKTDQKTWIMDFYSISVKRSQHIRYRYGHEQYDFEDGVMFFMAPGQVFGAEVSDEAAQLSGWMLLIHPDFLWNTPLAKTIRQYEYFGYSAHEALFLSEKEEITIRTIIQAIQQEYHSSIDKFSQNIIIAHLEALLNYGERFYQRQFITRKITSHKILDSLEQLLDDYFNGDDLISKGLPTVQFISDQLNVSPNYLRSLLKVLTGLNTQQHIHEKLIEKAKERLSTTNLTVSEIAYELGFEHSQSFSKLFKTKTNLSPLEFRLSFQ